MDNSEEQPVTISISAGRRKSFDALLAAGESPGDLVAKWLETYPDFTVAHTAKPSDFYSYFGCRGWTEFRDRVWPSWRAQSLTHYRKEWEKRKRREYVESIPSHERQDQLVLPSEEEDMTKKDEPKEFTGRVGANCPQCNFRNHAKSKLCKKCGGLTKYGERVATEEAKDNGQLIPPAKFREEVNREAAAQKKAAQHADRWAGVSANCWRAVARLLVCCGGVDRTCDILRSIGTERTIDELWDMIMSLDPRPDSPE